MSEKHPTKYEREIYNKTTKKCLLCGKSFVESWSKYTLSKFCSQKCSVTYSGTRNKKEIAEKVSLKISGRKFINGEWVDVKSNYYKNPKICPICGEIIPYEKKNNKTCSIKCGSISAASKNKGNPTGKMGGQRDKGGRSKSGYYKGHFCGSTYELVYTIYNLDHDIPFERNTKGFPYEYKGKIYNYYPDYITPDGYVEIKGYWSELVDVKANAVSKLESIKILYEKDLQYAFEYVSKTYLNGKKSGWQVLYDNHKPKYSKVCLQCGITFERETNKRTFCSYKCGALYRHKHKNKQRFS